ncbi:molybdopterin biosynthesis protein [Halobellus captivus]|uniref:molybdopterin biosynthesis protein n=1 Tax=Halobellus captivus TaxID=2592614 RepID=UPI00119CD022|nr:molybdopterin biosynthesis protein [Halobellus captivus]
MVAVSDRRQFRDLVDPAVAHGTISSLDLDPESETVSLSDARGRVLAERVDADLDVPGFDRASMDGYAVRGRDTFGADEADPIELDLVGAVHAGTEPDVVVGEGEAAEISTGAVMPEGADAVVMVERTAEVYSDDGNESDEPPTAVVVRTAVAPGDNVMLAGTDIAAGARALGPGTRLTAREIGLLSALGVDEVPVRGKPTVGIVSTGDELVRPGEDLHSERGQIYDVNSYTIAAGVEEAGGEARLYPHAGDDYGEMERLLVEAAEECDLVLSSGSTSASAVDVIYKVIEERGDLLLHGVAVKPGKPMLIGEVGESAYVGLPGYPVSALTIFRTFVAPAVRAAAGLPEPRTATVRGKMAVRERYGEGRLRLMPVGLVTDADGETLVYPVDKGSGATTSLVEADGVVAVDPDTEYLGEGEAVDVKLFSPDVRPPTLFAVGEDDPALSRLLDRLENPRFLPVGSREGLRRLAGGVPDVAVVAGPVERDVDTVDLGGWTREWGLVVPADNPEGVADLADLVDRDLAFVNRGRDAGVRASLDAALDDLADARGVSQHDLADAIRSYEIGSKGFESPARAVARGNADAGLGLRATAERLGLGFVPLGTESVRVRANPKRTAKPGIEELKDRLVAADDVFASLGGYESD